MKLTLLEDGVLDYKGDAVRLAVPNAVPAGSEDDVSMAMGWNFSFAADETAVINFLLGEELPAGFSVWHSDIESLTSIFFSSTLEIQSDAGPAPIPEPATIGLVSIGLFGILCFRRRIKK